MLRISATYTLFVLACSPLAFAATAAEKIAPDAEQASQSSAALPETWKSDKRQAALRLQLFLDKEGFGPGKIDGRWGGFSRKAAERWNASGNPVKITILESGELDPLKVADLPYASDVLATYEITAEDQARIGTLPDEPAQMAKLKELPYTSLMELVAEKFHSDPDYLREINGLASASDLKVGSKVNVPNVAAPFEISEPMALFKAAEEKKEADKKAPKAPPEDKEKTAPDLELTVLLQQQVLEVREAGKLIRSFPISPGASDNKSPAGDFKVSGIFWMPEFRWDKSMLENGRRGNDAHLLPPGPNNPVGVVWIALSADGIGIHGTPFPDAIGRNRSHGCIRLSNWDALSLAKTVTVGTRVAIK